MDDNRCRSIIEDLRYLRCCTIEMGGKLWMKKMVSGICNALESAVAIVSARSQARLLAMWKQSCMRRPRPPNLLIAVLVAFKDY